MMKKTLLVKYHTFTLNRQNRRLRKSVHQGVAISWVLIKEKFDNSLWADQQALNLWSKLFDGTVKVALVNSVKLSINASKRYLLL